MTAFKDLSGQKFNRLTVISRSGSKNNRTMWLCSCDCGNTCIADGQNLSHGSTKSCGCFAHESRIKRNTTHNMSRTPEYDAWCHLISRCTNKSDSKFHRYGGRGIKVCDRWRNSFENFIYDMGDKPHKKWSIDRVDNDKGYSPCNCRWTSHIQQCNNRSDNHNITYHGKTQSIMLWSRELDINYGTLKSRIHRGWSIVRAIETTTKPE